MELAATIASWSKEDKKVGAVITDSHNRITGCGYNGSPPGLYPQDEPAPEGSIIIHAEYNALLNATSWHSNQTLWVTKHPCEECAKAIIKDGRFSRVVSPKPDLLSRWVLSQERAAVLLNNHLSLKYYGTEE